MRPVRFVLALAAFSSACLAQTWELGVVGGYGFYKNPTISSSTNTGVAGFPSRAALGVVFGEDLYNYIGGEFRYLYRFGGPQLQSGGNTQGVPGYTNAVTYNLVFHLVPRETAFRPFVTAGSGIKAYTGSAQTSVQPLSGLATFRPVTQVEPDISTGAGVKYLLPNHVQIRAEFRIDMTPLPNDVIHPVSTSTRIHGWIYDFMPLFGVSYVF